MADIKNFSSSEEYADLFMKHVEPLIQRSTAVEADVLEATARVVGDQNNVLGLSDRDWLDYVPKTDVHAKVVALAMVLGHLRGYTSNLKITEYGPAIRAVVGVTIKHSTTHIDVFIPKLFFKEDELKVLSSPNKLHQLASAPTRFETCLSPTVAMSNEAQEFLTLLVYDDVRAAQINDVIARAKLQRMWNMTLSVEFDDEEDCCEWSRDIGKDTLPRYQELIQVYVILTLELNGVGGVFGTGIMTPHNRRMDHFNTNYQMTCPRDDNWLAVVRDAKDKVLADLEQCGYQEPKIVLAPFGERLHKNIPCALTIFAEAIDSNATVDFVETVEDLALFDEYTAPWWEAYFKRRAYEAYKSGDKHECKLWVEHVGDPRKYQCVWQRNRVTIKD